MATIILKDERDMTLSSERIDRLGMGVGVGVGISAGISSDSTATNIDIWEM